MYQKDGILHVRGSKLHGNVGQLQDWKVYSFPCLSISINMPNFSLFESELQRSQNLSVYRRMDQTCFIKERINHMKFDRKVKTLSNKKACKCSGKQYYDLIISCIADSKYVSLLLDSLSICNIIFCSGSISLNYTSFSGCTY